jgi:phosphate/sulfate permease
LPENSIAAILLAWITTLPLAGLLGAVSYWFTTVFA